VADLEVLVEGLGHPEGPDVLPDGRVIYVETYASEIGVWDPRTGQSGTLVDCGGGPNACMVGSDGDVYLTQNGGTAGEWRAARQVAPSIQRVRLDGTVSFVATEIEGIRLNAPNDLSFGPDGSLYFTDPGVFDPVNRPDPGYILAIRPDGRGEVLEQLPPVYPNGIVAEPDGSVVWVESYTRAVRRRRPDGTIEDLHVLAEGHIPDGLKVAANGDLWITSITSRGLDVIAVDGRYVQLFDADCIPLNCVFDGTWLYITDQGTFDTSADAKDNGRLVRIDAGVAGMPLFRGSLPARREA
jgi:gluconolactonase